METKEKLGWRDEWISERHREYGFDCPAVDIDFLMLEYNHGAPVALIEYKHVNALLKGIDFSRANIRALNEAARRMDIPFAVVFYCRDSASFQAHPLNTQARRWFRSPFQRMTELQYVEVLYAIRGLELPVGVSERLATKVRVGW